MYHDFLQVALDVEQKRVNEDSSTRTRVKLEGDDMSSAASLPPPAHVSTLSEGPKGIKGVTTTGVNGGSRPSGSVSSAAASMNGEWRKEPASASASGTSRLNQEDAKLREALMEDTAMQIWANRERRIKAVFERDKAPGIIRAVQGWKGTPHEAGLGDWEDVRKCVFCRETGEDELSGRLLVFDDGGWAHCNCALWSSEAWDEEGTLQGSLEARKRSKSLKCALCRVGGATVGCCHRGCKANFHFLCALAHGSSFFEDKRVYCRQHKQFGTDRCHVSTRGHQMGPSSWVLGRFAPIYLICVGVPWSSHAAYVLCRAIGP